MAQEAKARADTARREAEDFVLENTALLAEKATLQASLAEAFQKLASRPAPPLHPAPSSLPPGSHPASLELQRKQELVARLERQLAQSEEHRLELEMQGESGRRLLEQSRSDAQTISRAVGQNKVLKDMLAELETKVVSLTKDKLKLTNELQELGHRMAQQQQQPTPDKSYRLSQDEELQKAHATISVLKHEQQQLQESRLKEQSQLQQQCSELQDQVQRLAAGRSGVAAAEAECVRLQAIIRGLPRELTQQQSLSLTVQQLEMERDELFAVIKSKDGQLAAQAAQPSLTPPLSETTALISSSPQLLARLAELEQHNAKMVVNFDQLQAKFVDIMNEKATLYNRVQLEEHLTAQLAQETETIGEFISLYQSQREALQERGREKDVFIAKLLEERDLLQGRLVELQQVIAVTSTRPPPAPPSEPFGEMAIQSTVFSGGLVVGPHKEWFHRTCPMCTGPVVVL